MKLKIKKFLLEKENCYGYNYGLYFTLKDIPDNCSNQVFLFEKFIVDNNLFLDIENITDTKFLSENNIEYIIEDKQVIPIGFIDFNSTNSDSTYFKFIAKNKDNLYKYNQIIKNFLRAIEIKYETIKFKEQFKTDTDEYATEIIDLDI